MKFPAALLTLSLVANGSASAAVSQTGAFGHWYAFEGIPDDQTDYVCGIGTSWNDGRIFMMKMFRKETGIQLQFYKPTWQIPASTTMSVMLTFGRATPWRATDASGVEKMAYSRVPPPSMSSFIDEMMVAETFKIDYPGGTEPEWVGATDGLNQSFGQISTCLDRLRAAPTQPFAAKPSQPYGTRPRIAAPSLDAVMDCDQLGSQFPWGDDCPQAVSI